MTRKKLDYKAAELLAIDARNSIGDYCMNECHSLCCRKGSLTLTNKELKLLTGDTVLDPKAITVISSNENKLSLDHGCPSFINNKCNIHDDDNRPSMCKEFPLFIRENRIIVSYDCPAVDDNKLYPFMSKFKSMGFKIM